VERISGSRPNPSTGNQFVTEIPCSGNNSDSDSWWVEEFRFRFRFLVVEEFRYLVLEEFRCPVSYLKYLGFELQLVLLD
jgi:hypothetical protein